MRGVHFTLGSVRTRFWFGSERTRRIRKKTARATYAMGTELTLTRLRDRPTARTMGRTRM
jgi:hypothetical protein